MHRDFKYLISCFENSLISFFKIFLPSKEKFFLSCDEGIFNKQIQQLYVKGNVKFINEKNMVFRTTEMYFDFKKEIG